MTIPDMDARIDAAAKVLTPQTSDLDAVWECGVVQTVVKATTLKMMKAAFPELFEGGWIAPWEVPDRWKDTEYWGEFTAHELWQDLRDAYLSKDTEKGDQP